MDIQIIEAKKTMPGSIRVAAYARVSTDADEQENLLENQIEYFQKLISENPEYELVDVYHDFAMSGYKETRPGFQRMLADCRAGKVDMIITKSVTRFARNTATFLKATRELRDLGIGVYFELQNINTLTQAGELLVTVYAAFAEEESKTYRDLNLMSYKRRYTEGIPHYQLQRSLGYDIVDGEVVIVPEEAEIVKRIFKMTKDGYRLVTIASVLNDEGIRTKAGARFTQEYIFRMIRCESYKGDYVMQKVFSDEDRKLKKNHGERPQYYIEHNHPAIIKKALWQAANDAIDNRKAERSIRTDNIPMNEQNFPYMKKLYCAKCGSLLKPRKASTCKQYSFQCSGKKTYGKEYCSGISVPQKLIETWGDITDDYFISEYPDKPADKRFKRVKRDTWELTHSKKEPNKKTKLYNAKNYFFYHKVFCDCCGGPLTKVTTPTGRTFFQCSNYKHLGSSFCSGTKVPEEVMMRLPHTGGYFILREETINGEKSYSYTCKTEKPIDKKHIQE